MFSKINRTRKVMRDVPGLLAALTPDDAVTVDAPADFAVPAIEAALRGEYAPVAELLSWTRTNAMWDDRTSLVSRLGTISLRSPGWLEVWKSESPQDPDLATVASCVAITQAWEQRSGLRAENVSQEQFDAFHTSLAHATATLQTAVDLSPGDPEPWSWALAHARGLEAPREVFNKYLAALHESDRYHLGGNLQALQYLCKKWFGSTDEMWNFAAYAVDGAPANASVQVVPLHALFEDFVENGQEALQSNPARVEDAITRAREFLDANPDAGHHRTATARNLLARLLFHLKRADEAYDQLLAIGPHATETPWRYWGDTREQFLTYRRHISVMKATT